MKANAFIVLLVVILIALMIVAEPAVMAHHSFAAAFDLNKSITVKGTITRVEWANPHISIYLDVKDKAGTVTKWGVDGAAPSALVSRGLAGC